MMEQFEGERERLKLTYFHYIKFKSTTICGTIVSRLSKTPTMDNLTKAFE